MHLVKQLTPLQAKFHGHDKHAITIIVSFAITISVMIITMVIVIIKSAPVIVLIRTLYPLHAPAHYY